jgi:hypothetical protein
MEDLLKFEYYTKYSRFIVYFIAKTGELINTIK